MRLALSTNQRNGRDWYSAENDEPKEDSSIGYPRILRRALYVLTLQSDLAYGTPSAVREHFRGWRRVLLLLLAQRYEPEQILLTRSEDVFRGCHRGYHAPESIPKSWTNIYEQTAREAQMRLVELSSGIDIQLYAHHPRVVAKKFFMFQ